MRTLSRLWAGLAVSSSIVAQSVAPRPNPVSSIDELAVLTPALVELVADVAELPPGTRAVRGRRIDGAALAAILALPGLERLELTGLCEEDEPLRPWSLPDRALERIAAVRTLRWLSLEVVVDFDARALRSLEQLPLLEKLRLRRCDELSDEHVAACARLTGLRDLWFESYLGTIGPRGMDALVSMKQLVSLSLRGTFELDAASYRKLGSLRGLEVLDLSGPWYLWPRGDRVIEGGDVGPEELLSVDDSVLEVLAELPELRVLKLAQRRGLTDAGLARLSSASKLEELDLAEVPAITDAGLAALPPTLRVLDVTGCLGVGREFPDHLRGLRELRASHLPLLEDASVATIAAFPELRVLDISGGPALTPGCLPALCKAARLEVLDLGWLDWLDDAALEQLVELARLTELDVGGSVEPFRIEFTSFAVGGPTRIGDGGVRRLAKLKRLQKLDLSSARRLHVASLRELADLPLQELELNWIDVVYDDDTPDFDALTEIWPGVTVRWWPSFEPARRR